MINYSEKTLIILAHIDDEFAMAPIIKKIANINTQNIKILYCAERFYDSEKVRLLRRRECLSSLSLLSCKKENIDFLNNYFFINDLKLFESTFEIYQYLDNLIKSFRFSQILTLNFEGGHPDHDSLALLVDKFAIKNSISKFFFPAYNYRNNFGIPLSVFIPLKSQVNLFNYLKLNYFCWKETFLIALIYKSEWKAFLKLLPFIIFNLFFSNKIYYSSQIDIDTVNWYKSLSFKIYKAKYQEILSTINRI